MGACQRVDAIAQHGRECFDIFRAEPALRDETTDVAAAREMARAQSCRERMAIYAGQLALEQDF
jgi:hypothetical protein